MPIVAIPIQMQAPPDDAPIEVGQLALAENLAIADRPQADKGILALFFGIRGPKRKKMFNPAGFPMPGGDGVSNPLFSVLGRNAALEVEQPGFVLNPSFTGD